LNKKEFDSYRGGIWTRGAAIVDETNAARDAGRLTPVMLSSQITALSSLMAGYLATYEANVGSDDLPADWAAPRFHDFYDFFQNILRQWNLELSAMSAPPSPTATITPPSPVPAPPQPGVIPFPSQAPAPPSVSIFTDVGLPIPGGESFSYGGGEPMVPYVPGEGVEPSVETGLPWVWIAAGVAVIWLLSGPKRASA